MCMALKYPNFHFPAANFPHRPIASISRMFWPGSGIPENVCKGLPQLQTIDENHIEAAVKFKTVSFQPAPFFCNCKCEYCDLWPHKSRGYGYEVLPTLESLQTQDLLDKNCFFSWGRGNRAFCQDLKMPRNGSQSTDIGKMFIPMR